MSNEEGEKGEKKKVDSDNEIEDPYINGERNKKSDIRSGFLMSIGQMVILTLLVTFSMFFGGFVVVGIIYIGIFIGSSISFFKKNRRFIAFGMLVPNSIGLLIGILILLITGDVGPEKSIISNNIHLFFLVESICIFIASSFLSVIIILKRKYPLWEEKKRSHEGEDPNIDGNRKKVVDFLLGIILMIGEYIAIDSSYRVPSRYLSNILFYLFLIIPIILIFLFIKKNRIYLVIGIAIGYYGFSIMTENVYLFFYGPFVAIGAFLYYLYLRNKKKKDISSKRPS